MRRVERIIDANANRAREALRVMEDAARFLLDDATLAGTLKAMRHTVTQTVGSFGLVADHRDVAADVGRDLSQPSETRRPDSASVVVAAGKRLGEALRGLEEYAKTIDVDVARRFEQMRYAAYEHETKLARRLARRGGQWSVCVLLPDNLAEPAWRSLADAVVAAAPDAIQLREKIINDDERLARACYLVKEAAVGTAIIVNDRPDIALMAEAHGVHLGQRDLPVDGARRLLGDDRIIGVSTSTLAEAKTAWRDGADYCGVGPMFASTTKDKPTIVGVDYLRVYLSWNKLPHLAIGGITPTNLTTLVDASVRGVAVCDAVCGAADPGAVIERMREQIVGVSVRS